MEGVSYLLFCFNHFKLQNLCCVTSFTLVTFSWQMLLAKQFLPPSQASVVESVTFVEMKSRCAEAGKQCSSALFACKQVSVLEQVSVNLGLCAIGISMLGQFLRCHSAFVKSCGQNTGLMTSRSLECSLHEEILDFVSWFFDLFAEKFQQCQRQFLRNYIAIWSLQTSLTTILSFYCQHYPLTVKMDSF